MKKTYYFFILALLINVGYSQNMKEKREKIKALKVGLITQKLSLTSEEAQKFWPIYNKYDDKIMDIRVIQFKQKLNKKESTPEEALKELEANEKNEAEIAALKKNMKNELIPIIGAEKVLKLYKLEQEFQKKLLEKLKNRNK